MYTNRKKKKEKTDMTTPDLSAAAEDRLLALHDIKMELTVEIGRTTKPLREVLQLGPGEIVVLDRPAGTPADLYVNGALFARGQVVEAADSGEYAVRITEVVTQGTSRPVPATAGTEA
jgi:flagellar motor switch protein FliN/FliY